MLEFRGQHPEFSIGLLSFTLEYVLVSNWPNNVLLKGYNSCDPGLQQLRPELHPGAARAVRLLVRDGFLR